MALVNKGVALGKLGKPQEAIGVFDDVVTRFGKAAELKLRVQVAIALVNKGISLGKLGKPQEAIGVYDDVVTRFGKATEHELRVRVAMALVNKGAGLGELGKSQEAIGVYDDVVTRFGKADEPELRVQVAMALVNKGIDLRELGKTQEAIGVFDDVVTRLSKATEPELRVRVAGALVSKGISLGELGKSQEAIGVYDDVVTRFGKADEPELSVRVAMALVSKGISLGELGKPQEAIGVYEDVVTRFGKSTSPKLKRLAASALISQGRALRGLGNLEEAISVFHQASSFENFAEISTKEIALTVTGPARESLNIVISKIRNSFSDKTKEDFDNSMRTINKRYKQFLSGNTRFINNWPFLLVLRRWNSYTPIVPTSGDPSRGGGYFLRIYDPESQRWKGIVIDPGYNFIENFHESGGRIIDIDCIIITHAHDDHTCDFEALLTLAYQYNKSNSKRAQKRLDIYLNIGADRKFSGLLDLRDAPYLNRLIVMNQGDSYALWNGLALHVQKAYHDEIITKHYSVGLLFEVQNKCFGPKDLRKKLPSQSRYILFTGDTGLFPSKKNKSGKVVAQTDGIEIPYLYKLSDGRHLCSERDSHQIKTDLIVAHIGSIYEEELKKSVTPEKRFYPNHLGVMGIGTLFMRTRPKLMLVSEFGEELKNIRVDLVKGIAAAFGPSVAPITDFSRSDTQERQSRKPSFVPVMLPCDLHTCYNIANGTLYCLSQDAMLDPSLLSAFEDHNELFFQSKETPVRDPGTLVDRFRLGISQNKVRRQVDGTPIIPPYLKRS
jgi:tetratricopeptide (TPR) repeat protein